MIKYIKILKWLINNREKLEKLIEKQEVKVKNDSFSLQGVPEFQMDYIKDLLKEDKI